jgi:hypothetical protein
MISSPSEVTTAKAPIKGAIGRRYSQLDQRTLFLSTLSQRPPVTRAIYANPADAFWSGSISDCAENGFSR